MTTAIIPERQREPLWAAYHGLPAAGHEMRAAVVIEPSGFCTFSITYAGQTPTEHLYRVTSGQPLQQCQ